MPNYFSYVVCNSFLNKKKAKLYINVLKCLYACLTSRTVCLVHKMSKNKNLILAFKANQVEISRICCFHNPKKNTV